MALVQEIKDGKIVESTTKKTDDTKKNGYDSEMFINLLVAEMKYQDPLEPTSNTEWVSQYATFSQVEQMESMANSLSAMQSENLVGKTVIMKSTDSSGETDYFSGQVSYVEKQSDGSYKLCVKGSSGEKMFKYEEIDTIVDADYLDALTLADTFKALVNALPSVDNLTKDQAATVSAVRASYDSMTSYQKGFVSSDSMEKLIALEAKLKQLQG